MNVGQCIRSQCCRIWSNHNPSCWQTAPQIELALLHGQSLIMESAVSELETPCFWQVVSIPLSSLGSVYSICWSLECSTGTLLKLLFSIKSAQTQLCKKFWSSVSTCNMLIAKVLSDYLHLLIFCMEGSLLFLQWYPGNPVLIWPEWTLGLLSNKVCL